MRTISNRFRMRHRFFFSRVVQCFHRWIYFFLLKEYYVPHWEYFWKRKKKMNTLNDIFCNHIMSRSVNTCVLRAFYGPSFVITVCQVSFITFHTFVCKIRAERNVKNGSSQAKLSYFVFINISRCVFGSLLILYSTRYIISHRLLAGWIKSITFHLAIILNLLTRTNLCSRRNVLFR